MKKPKLSFWQIWNMSRIFQTLGAEVEQIPILWIAAPVTGLILQPIIGHMSEKTWGRLGRRRPFFLVGPIMASIALVLMPNSPGLWIAVGMLWIMDASINISMEPFRAFVGDMLPNEQRTLGFTIQSFFIGIGAFVASWLPYILSEWFNVSNKAPEGEIPQTVRLSFYMGGTVFLLAVLWTVMQTKEYSPEELESFKDEKSKNIEKETEGTEPINKYLRRGVIWTLTGLVLAWPVFQFKLEKELYILAGGLGLFGILQLMSAALIHGQKEKSGLVSIVTDLYRMPRTMKQLAFVQFFSWFALFSMWIYTTPAVTKHLYGSADTTSVAYNEGANKMSGIGLAVASILAMPYAILTGSLPAHKMGVYIGIFNFFIVIPQILAATILIMFVNDTHNP